MSGGARHGAVRGLLAVAAAGGLLAGCGSAASRQGGAVSPPTRLTPAGGGGGPASTPTRVTPAGRVQVTPPVGRPMTSFRVSFTAPAATGSGGGRRRADFVTARTPGAARGCRNLAGVGVGGTPVRAGQRVMVVLAAAPRWCPGSYTGRVEMSTRPVCRPGTLCPQFIAVLPIGSFRFVVERG